MIAVLLFGAFMSMNASAPQAHGRLQAKIDAVVARCQASGSVNALVLSSGVVITFADPQANLTESHELQCVLKSLKEAGFSRVAVMGGERYIDEEGNER